MRLRTAEIALLLSLLAGAFFSCIFNASAEEKELKGFFVVEKVISAGAEPVYQVDGYRLRIAASTDKTFQNKLNSLADVSPGVWLRFAGNRDSSGVVVATKATFYPGKSGVKTPDPVQLERVAPDHESLIDSEGNFKPLHSKVRMSDAGGWCGWHKIPAEGEQQARVRRIGMSLIPAYQKQMADDQAAKIHFRFFLVDEKEIRSELACNPGLVLVPNTVLDRLKSDDELAAMLADGIAYNLQYQRVRMIASDGWLTAAEIADSATWLVNPIAGLATNGAVGLAAHEHNVEMELERGRLALSLMADAGYDPWQAPEAWKLLGPNRLPKNLASLKYPRLGQYQLMVLDAQYKGQQASGPGRQESAMDSREPSK
jgi:hypothetical protein